jgi:hypothetical protein
MQQIREILARMNAKLESWGEKTQAESEAFRAKMKAVIQVIRSELVETTACNETTESKPDPGMMQSTEEPKEIAKGEAAVMPVREPRKRRRVCNLAAERRQKRKERTRGHRASRRKSTAACSKVSRRAKVARRKGNIVRNKWTRAKAERGIQEVRTRHEGKKGVKDLGGGRPRYLRKRDVKKLGL